MTRPGHGALWQVPGPWSNGHGSGQYVEKNRLGFQSGNLAQPIESKQARFALVGKIDLQFQAGEADSDSVNLGSNPSPQPQWP
jgi:hypothetical protein